MRLRLLLIAATLTLAACATSHRRETVGEAIRACPDNPPFPVGEDAGQFDTRKRECLAARGWRVIARPHLSRGLQREHRRTLDVCARLTGQASRAEEPLYFDGPYVACLQDRGWHLGAKVVRA